MSNKALTTVPDIGATPDATTWFYVVHNGNTRKLNFDDLLGFLGSFAEATPSEIWIGTATDKAMTPNNIYDAAVLQTLSDSATVTPNFNLGLNFQWTIGGDRTLANPTNAKPGQSGIIFITQDGTGSREIALGASWKPIGEMDLSEAAGAVDALNYFVKDASNIYCSLAKDEATGGSGSVAALDDLTDVTITAASDGQYIKRVGGVWINAAPPEGTDITSLDDLSDVDLGGQVNGQFLKRVAGEWVPSNLPTVALDDLGDVNLTGAADGDVLTRVAGVWVPSVGGGFAGFVVEPISGTSYSVQATDKNKYIRLTNAGTKSIVIRDNLEHALPDNGEWHFRNAGAGDATFTPDPGVTVNPPVGGTLVIANGGTVTLKKVATDVFDLIGITVAA
jgi:hypothetical protein